MQHDIPFGKPSFSAAEADAVARVLASGWVGMGPETLAFEAELAAHVGATHVVSTNSCTSALHLSLLALGVGPGDEVIVPSLTWCSTANAALYVGATPVFCDIDPATFSVSPQSVAAALTPRTRAVLPVHFGGLAVDVRALEAAVPKGVHIVEDAAHALGARYADARSVGASGHLTCFSFYANKALSTGDGGAIALTDASTAERLRSLRLHGQPSDAWQRYIQPNRSPAAPAIATVGLKANFTDIQAAIGRVQLQRQAEFALTRHRAAQFYCLALAEALPGVQFQAGLEAQSHARHLFTFLLPPEHAPLRNPLLASLRAQGIGASLHYAPLHLMAGYAPLTRLPLPHTEAVAARILTLPIGPCVLEAQAEAVVRAFRQTLQRLASTAS